MKLVADMTTDERLKEIRERLEGNERKMEREGGSLIKDIMYVHEVRFLLDLIDRHD